MIKLLQNNVLIERIKVEAETTSFGLLLPDKGEQQKSDTGVVLGKSEDVCEVEVGDKIIFNKWDCEDVEIEGKKCTIVTEDKILAIIE